MLLTFLLNFAALLCSVNELDIILNQKYDKVQRDSLFSVDCVSFNDSSSNEKNVLFYHNCMQNVIYCA